MAVFPDGQGRSGFAPACTKTLATSRWSCQAASIKTGQPSATRTLGSAPASTNILTISGSLRQTASCRTGLPSESRALTSAPACTRALTDSVFPRQTGSCRIESPPGSLASGIVAGVGVGFGAGVTWTIVGSGAAVGATGAAARTWDICWIRASSAPIVAINIAPGVGEGSTTAVGASVGVSWMRAASASTVACKSTPGEGRASSGVGRQDTVRRTANAGVRSAPTTRCLPDSRFKAPQIPTNVLGLTRVSTNSIWALSGRAGELVKKAGGILPLGFSTRPSGSDGPRARQPNPHG